MSSSDFKRAFSIVFGVLCAVGAFALLVFGLVVWAIVYFGL